MSISPEILQPNMSDVHPEREPYCFNLVQFRLRGDRDSLTAAWVCEDVTIHTEVVDLSDDTTDDVLQLFGEPGQRKLLTGDLILIGSDVYSVHDVDSDNRCLSLSYKTGQTSRKFSFADIKQLMQAREGLEVVEEKYRLDLPGSALSFRANSVED